MPKARFQRHKLTAVGEDNARAIELATPATKLLNPRPICVALLFLFPATSLGQFASRSAILPETTPKFARRQRQALKALVQF